MSYNINALSELSEQFEKLPGIGRKTAQRLAFYVLGMSAEDAQRFAETIVRAHREIKRCKVCQNLSDTEVCSVCADEGRDRSTICVVEDPRDVFAFERTKEYFGTYHILGGLISPIDGIGPDKLYIKELLARLNNSEVKEIIMATSPTVEGEATAMYVSRLIKPLGIKVTRLAYGIPVGGDLEYADEITLRRSLEGRSEL